MEMVWSFKTNNSLLTFHISSVLNYSPSLESCLLMTAYPKSRTTSKTWDAIWQKLVHAFNNLQQGSKDDSIMMGGWKAVIWQLEGDHEYFQMFSNFHIGKRALLLGVHGWSNNRI